ncbi:MAG TPA: GH3 auxin-responsive promoter family protein, partial [Opitutaceae bacterium]
MTVGAGMLSARASFSLRRGTNPAGAQERVFRSLMPKLAGTSVWGDAGAEKGMSYEDFQAKLPLVTHEDIAPAINRMIAGEADVLWPGRCQIYCSTSGASTGQPRMVPVTEPMLRHFKQCSLNSVLWHSARVRHGRVFRGRHLSLTGSTAMEPLGAGGFEAYAGRLAGIAALNLPKWVEQHFYEPGTEIAQTPDWQAKIA